MNKKIIFIGTIVTVVLIASVAVLLFINNQISLSPQPSQTDTNDIPKLPTEGETVTISGKIKCLSPKDNNGAANTSCGIGLDGEDGNVYALSADDPTLTGSVPTGERVRVVGTFIEQATQYNTVGVIEVDSLKRL